MIEWMDDVVVVRGKVRVWGGACPTVANQRQKWRERWGVLLEVFDEEGRRGVGEAAPLPGFSWESLEDCREALEAWCSALPLRATTGCRLDRYTAGATPAAAQFAVEMALLDLQGKRGQFQVPVTAYLRWPLHGPTFVSRLLHGRRLISLEAQVRRGLEEGFRTFKVKLGGVGYVNEDVRLVQKLRAAVPGEWRLRVDLNGGWNLEQWESFHRGFAAARVELVEDPVAAEWLPSLPPSAVPVAADEALKWEEMAEALAEAGTCSFWVLKPTLLGGFARCGRLHSLARARGIRCLVSHCFEGPVALAAVRAAALVLGGPPHPDGRLFPETPWPQHWQVCHADGVDLHPALTAFPALSLPGGGASTIEPWAEPGLGVEP